MAKYRKTATVYAEPGGSFTFDNGRQIVICDDKDSVGEMTEQMLWPLMKPLLESEKDFKIIIEDGTD